MSALRQCRSKSLSLANRWVIVCAVLCATTAWNGSLAAQELQEETPVPLEETPEGKQYLRSLLKVHFYFETALIRQQVCGEAFPALRVPVRDAYRAWEIRNARLREEVGRKYFELLKAKNGGSVKDASILQDAVRSALERSLYEQSFDQLELICASYVESFTGPDADPSEIFQNEIATMRAHAMGSNEEPHDPRQVAESICKQGEAPLIAATYSYLGGKKPVLLEERLDLLEIIATQCRPSVLSAQAIASIHFTVLQTKYGSEERVRILETLFRAGLKAAYGAEPEDYWWQLTKVYLDRDRVDDAERVAARISDPMRLMPMLIDKRYDALTAESPERFDVDAHASAALARWRSTVARYPRSQEALDELLKLLNRVGHHKEVLERTEIFSGGIDSLAAVRKTFYNADKRFAWILSERARAYEAIGQPELAVPLYRAAATHDPKTAWFQIRLALLHQGQLRSEEALRVLEEIDTTAWIGTFDRMLIQLIKYRAALRTGDKASAAAHLAYIEEHETDSPYVLTEALLYSGDEERCAQYLIERLPDPERRSRALRILQTFLPYAVPPDNAASEALRRKLASRADVRAAAEEVGRIRTFNLVYD